MGFGDTAKRLQKVADMAEDVYQKLNDLREQVKETQQTVVETKNRVDRLESENAEQRALLEAIAEKQGIDLDSVVATAHIAEAVSGTGDDGADESADGDTVADAPDVADDGGSNADETASDDQPPGVSN